MHRYIIKYLSWAHYVHTLWPRLILSCLILQVRLPIPARQLSPLKPEELENILLVIYPVGAKTRFSLGFLDCQEAPCPNTRADCTQHMVATVSSSILVFSSCVKIAGKIHVPQIPSPKQNPQHYRLIGSISAILPKMLCYGTFIKITQ